MHGHGKPSVSAGCGNCNQPTPRPRPSKQTAIEAGAFAARPLPLARYTGAVGDGHRAPRTHPARIAMDPYQARAAANSGRTQMGARMLIPVPGPQAERNHVWDVAPGPAIRASSPHVQGRRPQGFRHHDLSPQGPEHRRHGHAPRGIMRCGGPWRCPWCAPAPAPGPPVSSTSAHIGATSESAAAGVCICPGLLAIGPTTGGSGQFEVQLALCRASGRSPAAQNSTSCLIMH